MKCKLWIEYWATLTLLLGRYIWTVWFYVFKIYWFLYLSNSETVTVATFEIRLTPLVSVVLPVLAKFVACVVHISSITHMLTPSCSQKENTISYKWFCHVSNMKGRQSSITYITMAAGSLSPALDERAAMKKKVIYLSSQDRRWMRHLPYEVQPQWLVFLVLLLRVPHISFPSLYYSEGMRLSRGNGLNHPLHPS